MSAQPAVRPPEEAAVTLPARADVVVIGAGQAGLSAAYHLRRRGLGPATEEASSTAEGDRSPSGSFVVLDGEQGPGGAWRHRWRTLRMATVNKVHDLPGRELPEVDPCAPSREVVPSYYGEYERDFDLPILRPVHVHRVEREDADPRGRLRVDTDAGQVSTRAVINATGTWTKPFWPIYPGQDSFRGRQLHTADYVGAEELAGQHVIVVGGGISAVQLLEEISHVAGTTWVTRREPVWRDLDSFDAEAGRAAVAQVEDRVRRGLPPRSVVSVTGLVWTPTLRAAAERGVLERRPMFSEITPTGVRWPDGTEQRADAILWATGFRSQLDHLAPLQLRGRGGGIQMAGTQVAAEPRVHLVGYGPSASTIGANRAGREAAAGVVSLLSG
ncbi:NAD(P)-binding domain-containing protein [Pseudactinotalea suaedae]|uniref:NAD(P)-binding domain-containing protein n=1 Tax=Pseudactinotalea suaedae TaxID=1524924 RepID=UPI001F501A7F|nr:NAD(P)-binding domain-containing protein [Pseudactinotalea suaedae]